MAGLRHHVLSELQVRGFRQSHRLAEERDESRIYRYDVQVPAGETRLQVLDSTPVAIKNAYVAAHSTVEGVQLWPIDAEDPQVSSTTRAFGPLFDWSSENFEHDHGAISSTATNHSTTGTRKFHNDSFPVFQSYEEDRASQGSFPVGSGFGATFFTPRTGPSATVRAFSSGYVGDLTTVNPPTGGVERWIMYFLGPTGYYDLGGQADGLGFNALVYAEDGATTGGYDLFFYSYPYVTTTLDLDLIPTTTPILGDTVWANDDRNLCVQNLNPNTLTTVGWRGLDGPRSASPTLFIPPGLGSQSIVDGYQSIFMPKPANTAYDAGTNIPVSGYVTFNRITMIGVRVLTTNGAASQDQHLVQVQFGPRPGLLQELRPYCYITSQQSNPLWAIDHKVAVGLRNPSSVPATVTIEYGGE